MNMSGIYREEKFWKGQETVWVEAEDITGTNCYCDEDARTEISCRIDKFSSEGVHFIDSGNYHYLTRLWIGKIKQPFRLLVFDNHTDMQPPAFGGLLSCGGWIAAALEELTNLRQVILIGPDENAYSQVDERLRKKVVSSVPVDQFDDGHGADQEEENLARIAELLDQLRADLGVVAQQAQYRP